MFEFLENQPADELLGLIKLLKADPRVNKLDLGVGVYRDAQGATPIMRAVKEAERILLDTQKTKTYIGPEGDMAFVELLKPIAFGVHQGFGERLVGVQTPGGSGALRLGADIISRAMPKAKIWIGRPTWPNHAPMFAASGLQLVDYPYFDTGTQTVLFDQMMSALASAEAGDAVLLHACCHNPSGADLSRPQWDALVDLIVKKGLFPFVDMAYQGLGEGLEADAYGARRVLSDVDEALVAYSCDKNFGLYRERTGALFGLGRNSHTAGLIANQMSAGARVTWSMPPDHGASVVRLILENDQLTGIWREELLDMSARVREVRKAVAGANSSLGFISTQRGLFSNLATSPDEVSALRRDHGVYMSGSGRINVAGMQVSDAPDFASALEEVGYLARISN